MAVCKTLSVAASGLIRRAGQTSNSLRVPQRNLATTSQRIPGDARAYLGYGGVAALAVLGYALSRGSSSKLRNDDETGGVRLWSAHTPKKDLEDEPETVPTMPLEAVGPKGADFISMEEVKRHFLAHDAWVVVDGQVVNVTHFLKNHPGGSQIIVANAGRDVTELFKSFHPPGTLEKTLEPENFLGMVNPEEASKSLKAFEAERNRIAQAREALPDVETMLGLDEIQGAAENFLSPRTVNYYGAASLDGYTLAQNRESFRKCRFVPRVMRDVHSISPQTSVFGFPSALPIYISPASNALLGHPQGELNLVRGAAKTGIVQGVSAAASFPLTEILEEKDNMNEELGSKMGMVYQVYVQSDRWKTEELVRDAIDSGVQALLLTVDTNVLDHRQSTDKLIGTRSDAEPGIKMGPFTDYPRYHDPKLNWADLTWLKDLAQGTPIYLKGVSHIDDVRMAKELNLAGCILSNHGGRQCDQSRTGFESLRAIHAEDPQLLKDIEVYIDGGVRRGSDVLKAVAFGARGVGLGRPFLWAQAAYGEQGVIRAVRILESEIVTAMRLLGVTSLDQVDTKMVECLQEMWK